MKNIFLHKKLHNKGFSLIEFMTVVTIFAIISTISTFSYNEYQDNIERTNIAQDIALTIRQAQLYGISASNRNIGSSGFQDNELLDGGAIQDIANDSSIRGVSVRMSGEIVIFEDINSSRTFEVNDRIIDNREILSSKNKLIAFVSCIGSSACAVVNAPGARMDITFKRPYPDAQIQNSSGDLLSTLYLVLAADDNSKNKYIQITQGGNINVGTNYEF